MSPMSSRGLANRLTPSARFHALESAQSMTAGHEATKGNCTESSQNRDHAIKAYERSTGVKKVGSANPGCEMQLRSHLDDDYVVAHPIEWYMAAIEEDGLT